MATTTVRVDLDTHEQLVALGAASGRSLIETVRDAAEALRRQRFAATVAGEYARLRSETDSWDDYLAAAEATDVADGIG